MALVKESATSDGATETWDLLVFQRELIVVCDLLVHSDRLLRVDHNLLLSFHSNHFGIAIRLCVGGTGQSEGGVRGGTHVAGVIYESGQVSESRRVDDRL